MGLSEWNMVFGWNSGTDGIQGGFKQVKQDRKRRAKQMEFKGEVAGHQASLLSCLLSSFVAETLLLASWRKPGFTFKMPIPRKTSSWIRQPAASICRPMRKTLCNVEPQIPWFLGNHFETPTSAHKAKIWTYGPQTVEFTLFWSTWGHILSKILFVFLPCMWGAGFHACISAFCNPWFPNRVWRFMSISGSCFLLLFCLLLVSRCSFVLVFCMLSCFVFESQLYICIYIYIYMCFFFLCIVFLVVVFLFLLLWFFVFWILATYQKHLSNIWKFRKEKTQKKNGHFDKNN